jgi:tetratricopeptide (TPR) repeat protein
MSDPRRRGETSGISTRPKSGHRFSKGADFMNTAGLGYSRDVNQNANPAARLARLETLLLAEPENLPLHRECVELAMRGNEYPRALGMIDARLARHPADPEALFARANALMGLRQFEDAVHVLKALEEQGVAPVSVMQNLATCNFMLGRYENVRSYGERLIAAGEKSADILQLTIAALHHLGEMDPAVKLADENAAAAASHGRLAGTCAMVFLDMGDPQKASTHAAVAVAQNPDSLDGLLVQATLAAANLDNEQAFRQFSRVLELAPQFGRAWLGLGMLATLAQDFVRARELLERATQLMPEHVGSWHALAWAHFFGGDAAGAEKHFAHALELDHNFAESHGALAAMLALKGDRAAAEREIEIAERLDKNNMSSQFARAMLLERSQGPQAGHEFIRNTVRGLASRFDGKPRAVLKELVDRKPRAAEGR